ncbi:hypothetical protein QBC41DRAFT_336946 [Cercophora samala]|uniref:Neuroparsin n=1 Tax=Cercophora samala TaxID=330535 RepID=A0AA39ZED3_9PEZI|nr:hypothetical protein QBC41DRAFT_336946 [Cercophora samala]
MKLLIVLATATLAIASPALYGRQHNVTGPCPVTATDVETCRDMIDASACWNGIIGANGDGSSQNAERLWNCVPGGKKNMCECYGCDWGLDRYVTRYKLCDEP